MPKESSTHSLGSVIANALEIFGETLGKYQIKQSISSDGASETDRRASLRFVPVKINSIDDLGAEVRRARTSARLDQQSLAGLAGVGRRFVSELENGKPTLEIGKVLAVTAALGIDLFAMKR